MTWVWEDPDVIELVAIAEKIWARYALDTPPSEEDWARLRAALAAIPIEEEA